MYAGIILKTYQNSWKQRTKFQTIIQEDVLSNGVIIKQNKVKTVDLKTDEKIKYRDFDIVALQSIGADKNLQFCQLQQPTEAIANAAEEANEILDIVESFKQQNNEQTKVQTNNEQTPNINQTNVQ